MKLQRFSPLFFVLALAGLSGCLKTRSEVSEQDEKKVIQTQVQTLQKQRADIDAQYGALEAQIRALNGRIETLEHQNEQSQRQREENRQLIASLEARIRTLEEGILQLDQKTEALKRPAAPPPSERKMGSFEEGEEHFQNKEWKKAITAYQKYRESSPKGEHYPEATYKIGVAFQELKMFKEARIFLEEVMERFPKSKTARAATYRLNQMKKK